MAATTVTGTVNGVSISFTANTAVQAALAQQILAAATSIAPISTGGTVSAGANNVVTGSGVVLTGSTTVASVQAVLDGQGGVYINNGSTLSTVVAADNSNSSIVNNTAGSGLVASTGAGGNVLLALQGANQFVTGNGGQDLVFLNGAANSLTSNGSDAVLVGGPSTITAGANGVDSVLMTSSANRLAFINGSKAGTVDSIQAGTGNTVVVAGTGQTSVASSGGNVLAVDTSAGNVTLNGFAGGSDTFEFVRTSATAGTGAEVVNNFTTADSVALSGVTEKTLVQSGTSAILTLSDNSTVTFTNASTTNVQSVIRPA